MIFYAKTDSKNSLSFERYDIVGSLPEKGL